MKLPKFDPVQMHASQLFESGVAHNNDPLGITLQNYYNVAINGTDMGNAACNYIFDRLPGYNTAVVRRCNDVYGCYRRVRYDGNNGITGLRTALNTIIGGSNYDVEANVNTRNSCA